MFGSFISNFPKTQLTTKIVSDGYIRDSWRVFILPSVLCIYSITFLHKDLVQCLSSITLAVLLTAVTAKLHLPSSPSAPRSPDSHKSQCTINGGWMSEWMTEFIFKETSGTHEYFGKYRKRIKKSLTVLYRGRDYQRCYCLFLTDNSFFPNFLITAFASLQFILHMYLERYF